MRELTENEVKQVAGGNLLVGGLMQVTGAYFIGQEIGSRINNYVNNNYTMTTGEALYHTLN